jgi:hypothetical protein
MTKHQLGMRFPRYTCNRVRVYTGVPSKRRIGVPARPDFGVRGVRVLRLLGWLLAPLGR